ncbi:hypothetical protein KFL_001830040 [Klebsormidium nitens]|uniref:Uncharacterized protein n=1 Tax=Klebsormidium nitens TaxID=105231 RepID=A0A1Y1I6C8_KLENI|nr:hypothetical protein KFL_001830040 [Klebsormidium nitens]|eukprot:GAQ84276.1 hypothetical protein KFL_001830040 [Klebsormidium nitens]
MARELPGFYFDTEKNRYFPVPRNGAAAGRGIPADGKRPQVTPESDRDGGPSREVKPTLPPSQFSLLQRRERSGAFVYGRDAPHGRRFTSASWEAGFRDYTVWGFGNDPHFGASADSSLHGAGPFLQVSHGSRTIFLAGDEHGLNALEPRGASEDPLSIHGVKLLDSRPGAFLEESENSSETTAIDSGATGREDNTTSRQEEESDSEGSSSDDDLDRKRGFYFRGRRRKPWFQRKRKRKTRGVWRDTGQGLQRIDVLLPKVEGRAEREGRGARGESSTQAGRKERCPVDLALLSSLPLQSRVTALRSAGRAEEWGGDQRFIATTLGSNTTAGSFLLLHSREGDTWTEPDVVRRHYFDKESIWTGDISSNGRQAVIGASTLGFRIQLETWAIRPLAPSNGSATLAQQFDSTGNLVLSGFRNGAISTVDLRPSSALSTAPQNRSGGSKSPATAAPCRCAPPCATCGCFARTKTFCSRAQWTGASCSGTAVRHGARYGPSPDTGTVTQCLRWRSTRARGPSCQGAKIVW